MDFDLDTVYGRLVRTFSNETFPFKYRLKFSRKRLLMIIIEDDSRDWSFLILTNLPSLSLSLSLSSIVKVTVGCWCWCYKIFTIQHTNWFDDKKFTIFISFHYSSVFTDCWIWDKREGRIRFRLGKGSLQFSAVDLTLLII